MVGESGFECYGINPDEALQVQSWKVCGPKALDLVYSETGGSSKGVRFYLRYLCKEELPIKIVHSRLESPRVTAFWENGDHFTTNLHGLNPHQVEAVIDSHMNSEGSNIFLRHGGPRVWSINPSIQGLWKPTLESSINALRPFHESPTVQSSKKMKQNLTFPKDFLELSKQFVTGRSKRWGSNSTSRISVVK